MTATPNAVPDSVRAAAEHYLGLGYLPVPVPRVGNWKAPLLEGWEDLRPRPEDLDRLFPTGEPLNVGLLLGAPSSGLVDVDLDCPEALVAAPFFLPATGWVSGRASKPQSHWWYRVAHPPGKAAEEFHDLGGAMLVELRSTGGQTIVPPSLHPSEEPLGWHSFDRPEEVDLADLLQAVRSLAAAALLARHWPQQGARQRAFLALAGGLLRAGWPQDRVERFVEAVATVTHDEEARKRVQSVLQTAEKLENRKTASGWPTLEKSLGGGGAEVVAAVRAWLGTGGGNSPAGGGVSGVMRHAPLRPLEPYLPFPTHALPAPLAEYVRQGAVALGCDPAYLGLTTLAVAAGLIGYTRALRLKRSWKEFPIIWSLLVGESGSLKSPAYRLAVDHLFTLQRRLHQEYREALLRYQLEVEAYEEARRVAKAEGTDPPEPPREPVEPVLFSTDSTIEALAEIIEDNPRGLLVTCDELTAWFSMFARYHTGKQGSSDLPRWLSMHSAGGFSYHRKTGDRRRIVVPHAAVSVTGGIQPGVLARALTAEFLDAGLAARLLMAMPPRLPKRWTEIEIAPEAEEGYHKALDGLLRLGFDERDGERVPVLLHLSAEGKAAWVRFYDGWAQEQAAAEGELAAAFSKLEAYAARFALLHHVVTCVGLEVDDRREVGLASVEAGVTLCRWFAREARRLYRLLAESAEQRETRRLVEFIQGRGGAISVRGLMRANCRRFPDAEAAESALAGLVEAGVARWVNVPTTMQGGKPIKAVELCMTHDTDDTAPPEGDGGEAGRPEGPDGFGDDSGPPSGGAGGSSNAITCYPSDTNGESTSGSSGGGVIGVMRHALPERGGVGRAAPQSPGREGEGGPPPAVIPSPLILTARGQPPAFREVRDADGLEAVKLALGNSGLVGVDLETTGLDPRGDRIRLLSLSAETVEGGRFTYLIDAFATDLSGLWEHLGEVDLVLHHAAFDLGFLGRRGFVPTRLVHDTMLLAQLLVAGTGEKVSLEACCRRWLAVPLDKAPQKSDWAGTLSPAQLAYAARDVEVLAPLLVALREEVRAAGLERAADIEHRCLRGVVWMARSGVGFDRPAWEGLAKQAAREAENLREELDRAAPPRPGEMFQSWNWDSAAHAREALGLAGCPVNDTSDETLAGLDQPLAGLLRRYRLARKRSGSYGEEWLKHVADDGRVYASWRQMGAASGRMSCSTPNLQQMPRGEYRRCVAAPAGRVLVRADYGQIEVRIAAKVSGDEALLEAYRRGEDLHAITARNVLGVAEVTRQDRQLAKALNFGLLYGMGAAGLRAYARSNYGVELSEKEAARYRKAFFRSYPGLARWHRSVGRSGKTQVQVRTLTGRRRLGVQRFTEKLNSPVQGTGADGLKLALALLWERRGEVPGAFPVLAVHDEIVVECDAGQAEAVADWLRKAMLDAMAPLLDPVPMEVEVKVARTWGGD